MNYKKNILTGILLTAFLFSFGQQPEPETQDLPSIIPPSPELSSLVKAGSASIGMHTGSATVSIPLYTLKVGSINLPIALSYSSVGTRVNDIASRVGMGWNLIAGVSISK